MTRSPRNNASPTNIAIVLQIGVGSFEQGFPVTLQILNNHITVQEDSRCPRIPPASELAKRYRHWEERYKKLGGRGISPVEAQITHESSLDEYLSAEKALKACLTEWFNQEYFRSLQYQICAKPSVRQDESVPVIFKIDSGNTEDDINLLRKIPWHFWSLFNDEDALPNAEVVLSTRYAHPVEVLGRPVRILAIFGSSEGGLQLSDDEAALERLRQRGAEITPLQQPGNEELDTRLRQESWDILFFAGHSYSETDLALGSMLVRDGEFISLGSLRSALQKAVHQGLRLAIFNSCDGLGIANYLAHLGVPTMIVMREPVPDLVARKFLEYFLEDFSNGTPLYRAVRQARERLQWLENNYSCLAATRLPIICQNPVQPELVWPQPPEPQPPLPPLPPPPPPPRWRQLLRRLLRWLHRYRWGILAALVALTVIMFLDLGNRSTPPEPPLPSPSPEQISLGEEILSTTDMTAEKKAGRDAFARGDYRAAEKHFTASLQQQRNDPETVIYQNNAKVMASRDRPSLRMAVSVPIGSNSNVAQEILRGVAQAQDEINTNEGINGAGLVVAIANDDNDPNIAKQVATAFVEDDKILAVVGHNASNASVAAAPIYQKGKLVMVTPTSFANDLSGFGDYIFRTVPHIRLMAARLAEYAVKTAQKRDIAVCYDSQALDNVSFKDEFIAELSRVGGRLVPMVCDVASPTFNSSNAINQAINNQAQGLLLSPHIDRISKAIELARANQNQLALFGSPTMYTFQTLDEGREKVKGLVLTASWHPQMNPGSPFVENACRLWGGNVSWRTASSYDAVRAISAGFQQSNTRSGLQQVLINPGFYTSGASEDVRFNSATGDRETQPQLIQVREAKPLRSETGFDFVLIK